MGVFGGSATAAHQSGASATPFSPRQGEYSGLVQPRTVAAKGGDGYVDQCPCGPGNLVYHGGTVMLTNKTYNIFWQPTGWSDPFPAGYMTKINQYLIDVAHDSSLRTNVYATDTQYFDTIGGTHFIAYNSTFAGSVLDTAAFPASGCTDSVAQTTVCLTDTQLRAKINAVVAAHGWPRGAGVEYFLYTPFRVGSSFTSGPTYHAYTDYCAYHSNFNLGSGTTIYANQPFTKGTSGDGIHLSCEAVLEYPNGASTGADPTISVVSHEHNESITDWGNSWYDTSGQENGDKCAWSFGTMSGVAGTRYNQTINGHQYLTQLEWNNSAPLYANRCVQRMPALAPTVTSFVPTAGGPGVSVTINGTGFGGVVAVRFHGTNASFSVNSGMKITAQVPVGATTGTISVQTTSGTGTSAGSFTVLPAPTISSFTPTNGKTGTNVTIHGTNLSGSTSVRNGSMLMQILSNTSTTIVARIRDWGAYSPVGHISSTNANGTATSAGNFTVTFGITTMSPTSGTTGALVTLGGRGTTPSSRVRMTGNLTPGVVPSSIGIGGTSLQFHVPSTWAGTHTLTVTNTLGVTGTVTSYWNFHKT